MQKWPNIWTLCTIVKDQKDIKNNLHLFAYFLVKPKYHTRIPIMIYVLKNWILFHKWWFVFAQLVKLSTIKILENCRSLTVSHQICTVVAVKHGKTQDLTFFEKLRTKKLRQYTYLEVISPGHRFLEPPWRISYFNVKYCHQILWKYKHVTK